MRTWTALGAIVAMGLGSVALGQTDNIGHRRHTHTHGQKHQTVAPDGTRFITNRSSDVALPLPAEKDAFTFVIFGDRTGGPDEGVSVLADAVRDVNLLEPDFVITVGDLIQGYSTVEPWMEQMREYKGIMNELLCPWFPVAGNHDTYWRGPNRPPEEHEGRYEMHFGPLWYAFTHKDCMFVVLYTDEGNPETGERNFRKPESQRMSPEQLNWLRSTLEKGRDAKHVFCFVHHPRWLRGGYGNDWDNVHRVLAEAGNVRAVFAGHIHRMRYDGPKDGIEYVTLATTGGHQRGTVPDAGFLHHFHTVTVREDQIAMASLPVGEVLDVREITAELQAECEMLSRMAPLIEGVVEMSEEGGADVELSATISNPTSRPIDVTLAAISGDSRWLISPDHEHRVIQPGDRWTLPVQVYRSPFGLDDATRLPELEVTIDYLAKGARYAIPTATHPLPVRAEITEPPSTGRNLALSLDGRTQAVIVPNDALDAPNGPLTIECWFKAESFGRRVGLIAKTQNSDYGIFVSNGQPEFSIYIGDRYLTAEAEAPILETGEWTHVAGVYDGEEARLYVNGREIASNRRSGDRRTNALPFIVGADVDGAGNPTSHFHGMIDEVRVSSTARYTTESFTPARRHTADANDLLLLHMDGRIGPWLYDSSPSRSHPLIRNVRLSPVVGN